MDPSLRHFLSTLQAKVEGEEAMRSVPLAHLPVHVWGVYAETIPTKVGGFYLTCHVSLNRQNAPPVSTLAEARWAFHRKIGQHIQERTLSHSFNSQTGR